MKTDRGGGFTMRALVIDDSRTIRTIIGKILKEIGMEVLEAGNGRQGLEQMKVHPGIELILVDWNMPEMNGLDFIKALRAQKLYDRVRILMVTSETETEQVTKALNAGANEYLMKPFSREILIAKLDLLNIYED
jgi:two-component system, chemotaxis family, chemotaxis protein CheY